MEFGLYQAVQLISLITAIFCYKGLKKFKLTAFVPLLILVCIVEFIAGNYKMWGWPSNYIVYDLYFILSTPILLYILNNMLAFKKKGQLIYWLINSCLMLFVTYNTFFLQGLHKIDTYSYLTVESFMVIWSLIAIFRQFLEDDAATMLNEHPYFWINGSTVIFGLGILFIMGLSDYIIEKKIFLYGKHIYQYVTKALNFVLYISYSYAFILCRKLTVKQS
ncbi:hypothetical protein BDD43_1291 [Mucilaginibacter gracilis]|uniref:YhhN-like protein n=1 Tax=Mucilaginibacter gracilis TaxID=423350 RepID=A0A495IWM5_9SPHI|nr:hypothetical protein BDD43_1291 [Mucilaginibacter gracilis]